MLILWTMRGVKMSGVHLWLTATVLQALLLTTSCSSNHHRRSMATQQTLPLSKGGWRPVVGSGGLLYGSFGTAPLHAPSYKVPVIDSYQSSARPLVARDATKLTSIAQSYRATTTRTVPAAHPPANQPINTYHNPFAIPNTGFNYKFIQNFPVESVVLKNPHNPYAARPVYHKTQTKFKQPAYNAMLQQLTNVQPIHFGQYPTAKPLDVFGKPVEVYARPTDSLQRPQTSGQSSITEIFKPEVFKLPDSDTASQSLNQQVKTAQQQGYNVTPKIPVNSYQQYAFQDSVLPPNILGTFGSFGLQSVKGRDPVYTQTKTTYSPQQPTRQTIFNSFSYSPNFKSTPTQFSSTTPKLQTTANQLHFGTIHNLPTQQTKLSTPLKIDPNIGNKGNFKASPQDPFVKNYQNVDYNKVIVSTYKPIFQTTTLANNFFSDYNYPLQQNLQLQNYYNQQTANFDYEKKNQKIHDNIAASVNQNPSQQYVNSHSAQYETKGTSNLVPHRATYEVTEAYESDITQSSPAVWSTTPDIYDHNSQKTTEETVTKQEFHEKFSRPTTTPLPDLPEEYAIVTEAEKGYENSLSYDSQVESQSRRPLSDDFEPIGKHKLKDYYYKVSTPAYDSYHTSKKTKKPIEASRLTTQQEMTTERYTENKNNNNNAPVEALPTLPPNRHFKRPSTPEPLDKDRIRKRNKIRRRRPSLANLNRDRDETSTRKSITSTTEPVSITEAEEVHTIRPRIRPPNPRPQLTTPSVTTDLTTSALPTISPTTPTIIKKKLTHRRPITTPAFETTTQSLRDFELNSNSPIMKIGTRPQYPKLSSTAYQYKITETPDYSHKQDEKDTPTSDPAVSLTDTLKTTKSDPVKAFSFHRDVKPIEATLEPVTIKETTTVSLKDNNENSNEIATTTSRVETTADNTGKTQRPRNKIKYERPRFSVKDYRNRLSSTTSTAASTEPTTSKLRFPQRRVPYNENKSTDDTENTTERKKFMPKEPRHKPVNGSDNSEQSEREVHAIRQPTRQRQTTVDTNDGTTQKISARIRSRRPRPTEETTEITPTTVQNKRLLRKKIKDSEVGESVQDISVTETTVNYDHKSDITSERAKSESAIMKIADKKQHDHLEHLFEHSKRVSDLTLAASKDYNTPGMFKSVSSNSRRIPNYFTIATEDPILPIEAFFPQLNQKKES